MSDYPSTVELDKVLEHQEQSQAIGAFIEWLSDAPQFGPSRGYGRRDAIRAQKLKSAPVKLCLFDDGEWTPVSLSIEEMLAKYYDIDLEQVETERSAVLEHVRELYEEQAKEKN